MCAKYNIECTETCRSGDCAEEQCMMTDFRSQEEALTEVKASQAVPGQKGLFALTNISQNTMLGHYRGIVVLGEPDDDTDRTVRRFRIAAGKSGSDAEVCADP
jgi:hypothetical protein